MYLWCQLLLVMKTLSLGLIPATLLIVACDTMNAPMSSSSFDPLNPPGSGIQRTTPTLGPTLTPGAFVNATIENTAFYKAKPKGNADADKLLTRGTQMKIVSSDDTFAQVELDSGEVGYVPAVMIQAVDATTPTPELAADGTYQVYPPLPDVGTLDPLPDVGTLGPLPDMDPGGVPPEGAIPAIIDPDAPVPLSTAPISIDPIPDLTPTETVPSPAADSDTTKETAAPTGTGTGTEANAIKETEEKTEDEKIPEEKAADETLKKDAAE